MTRKTNIYTMFAGMVSILIPMKQNFHNFFTFICIITFKGVGMIFKKILKPNSIGCDPLATNFQQFNKIIAPFKNDKNHFMN